MKNYRFYSFVAGHYLSPMQAGLQTGHAISEMHVYHRPHAQLEQPVSSLYDVYDTWARDHKTIIILNAGNHAGVLDAWNQADMFTDKLGELNIWLPSVVFHEDEQSMNKMATACGIIVPDQFYDVKFDREMNIYSHEEIDGPKTTYHRFYPGSLEHEFISWLKAFPMYR